MQQPNLTFTAKVNNRIVGSNTQEISSGKVSYHAPYNRIDFTYRSDVSLDAFQVRITKADNEYDVDKGYLAYSNVGSISTAEHTFNIEVNSTSFSEGSGLYRICLYCRNAIDNSWNVVFFFLSSANETFELTDGFLQTADENTYEPV